MKKRYLVSCIFGILCFSTSIAQSLDLMQDGLIKAYLFHVVRKSPILENNMGKYVVYSGPDARMMNGDINFDSLETYIKLHPESITFNTVELNKCDAGIILEATHKVALWELNKCFESLKNPQAKVTDRFSFSEIEKYMLQTLPGSAISSINGERHIHKSLLPVLNPALSFEDKASLLGTMNFLSDEEQLQFIRSLNEAISSFLIDRIIAYNSFGYLSLQPNAVNSTSHIISAGDGIEDMENEVDRDKAENNAWTKGLPKASNFFGYRTQLKPEDKRKKSALQPVMMPILDFKTPSADAEHNQLAMHFDVWQYSKEKQTTVVIHYNGLSYHLFGNTENRFLSPDSTFGGGQTFQGVINDLQVNKIDVLYEKIYGKRGFDYQIEQAEKNKDDIILQINKKEHSYSDITQGTIVTSKKVPRSVKKAKKKALKNTGRSAQDPKNAPKVITYSDKKKRAYKQFDIVSLYGELDAVNALIKQLKIDKQNAIDLMAQYQRKMDSYTLAFGTKWAKFTEKDGLFIFQDSSTFDFSTQELTLKSGVTSRDFEVQILPIPDRMDGKTADEIAIHISSSEVARNYNARIQKKILMTVSNGELSIQLPTAIDFQGTITPSLFDVSDSINQNELFKALLEKDKTLSIVANAKGIEMNPNLFNQEQTNSYLFLSRGIEFVIESIADNSISNRTIPAKYQAAFTKAKLTATDYRAALQCAYTLQAWKEQILMHAKLNLSAKEVKIVTARLKQFDKAKIQVGSLSLKWKDLIPESK